MSRRMWFLTRRLAVHVDGRGRSVARIVVHRPAGERGRRLRQRCGYAQQ